MTCTERTLEHFGVHAPWTTGRCWSRWFRVCSERPRLFEASCPTMNSSNSSWHDKIARTLRYVQVLASHCTRGLIDHGCVFPCLCVYVYGYLCTYSCLSCVFLYLRVRVRVSVSMFVSVSVCGASGHMWWCHVAIRLVFHRWFYRLTERRTIHTAAMSALAENHTKPSCGSLLCIHLGTKR